MRSCADIEQARGMPMLVHAIPEDPTFDVLTGIRRKRTSMFVMP